jgi:two-component system, OmpR family, sensor histidine kinase ChvG
VAPILHTLKELQDATRGEDEPWIELRGPDSGLVVRGVEDRLVQVFRNIISNAESFSPPRGRIAVSTRKNGDFIEITVDDEGPGIPEGKLEHIFDRFYSERPREERFGQHSGLGLSISRQIVEALRGRITAENRHGPDGRVLGARFVVALPVG